VLTVRAVRADEGIEQAADLRWALFAVLARAVGLSPQRVVEGGVVTTTLAFPDPDARPAPNETEPADGLPRTAPTSGRRVLLIEAQERARLAAHDLMRDAGMRVDSAASVEQARLGLRDGLPDVVVTGLAVDDASMAALLEEIRDAQPRLRVVQVVDDDDAFAFSAPEDDHPAQVGRSNLASTLVPAVAQELDAAWAT
jgi:CheY-like chemotaxis protein